MELRGGDLARWVVWHPVDLVQPDRAAARGARTEITGRMRCAGLPQDMRGERVCLASASLSLPCYNSAADATGYPRSRCDPPLSGAALGGFSMLGRRPAAERWWCHGVSLRLCTR
jgi:hypothetical protein